MKMNAGIWIGIIGGIVGLLVGIGAVLLTAGELGIYIAGGMLVMFGGMFYLFYRLFFKPMINAARLHKHGVSGKATIMEVRDTGVTVNNSPQVKLILEVRDDLGQKYSAQTRVLVPRLNPLAYRPGMEIPVKIDPKNKLNVVPDMSNNGYVASGVNPVTKPGVNISLPDHSELEQLQRDNDAISMSGRRARAIIKSHTWLGVNVNGNNPLVALEVEVLPDTGTSFSGTAKGVVSESSLSKYQPGKEIFVKYDYYDNSKIVIDGSV